MYPNAVKLEMLLCISLHSLAFFCTVKSYLIVIIWKRSFGVVYVSLEGRL